MTREDYIFFRQNNNIGNVAYDYYVNHCSGKPMDLGKFSRLFTAFIEKPFVKNRNRRYPTEPSFIRIDINWNLLWSLYDSKFQVSILYTDESHTKILKIW